jgi:ketosteroid isomerase-like protein
VHSAEAVELAFYTAFAAADVEAMAELWATGGDVLCIHPAGLPISGHAEVLASWRGILGALPPLTLEFEPVGRFTDGDLVVSTVFEHFRLSGAAESAPPVLATNVYRRIGGDWKMVAHHASPVDPRALRVAPAPSMRH